MALTFSPKERIAFGIYNALLKAVTPLLRLNRRLAEGYKQRSLNISLPKADIWIQAASVGESYLAWEIVQRLNAAAPYRILVTVNTKQGMEVLCQLASTLNQPEKLHLAYFPFDQPELMQRAVKQVQPKTAVLLETELWPGFMAAVKKSGASLVLANARISERSLRRYQIWPSVWHRLKPDRILAISDADAERFRQLFGPGANISRMPNIKFDRIALENNTAGTENPLSSLFQAETPLLVLGSVRGDEEPAAAKVIQSVLSELPDAVIALFPRHLHRVPHWEKQLAVLKHPWMHRSELNHAPSPGTIILWDTFGELIHAYQLADAAFVGGSLAPLGGQNFLEPLITGILPVIGPSREDFHWVGNELFDQGLVRIGNTPEAVAEQLIQDLRNSSRSEGCGKAVRQFLNDRRGGTECVCRVIEKTM